MDRRRRTFAFLAAVAALIAFDRRTPMVDVELPDAAALAHRGAETSIHLGMLGISVLVRWNDAR